MCTQVLSTVLVAALCSGPLQPAVVSLIQNHSTAWRWGSLIAMGLSMLLCAGGKQSPLAAHDWLQRSEIDLRRGGKGRV